MPAKPSPLRAVEPGKRPKGVSDHMWTFPRALERIGNRLGLSQAQIAVAAGVDQSTVSRWLNYKGLSGIATDKLRRLEEKLHLEPGELLPRGTTTSALDVSSLARNMGIDQEILLQFSAKENGAAMQSYTAETRRAILGIVHVYGATLEQATAAAALVSQEFGAKFLRGARAPDIFDLMRARLKLSDESGTHPSVGKIALGGAHS